MKRALYFFTDRLQITYAERAAILTLGGLILLLTGASSIYSEISGDKDFNYDAFIAEFETRAIHQEQQMQAIQDQYFPDADPAAVAEQNQDKVQAAETNTAPASVTPTEDTGIPGPAEAAASDKIDINKADADELVKLPGVGPAIAARIIEYREKNGPFKSIEDIKNVRGIGDARFNDIKDKIKVSG